MISEIVLSRRRKGLAPALLAASALAALLAALVPAPGSPGETFTRVKVIAPASPRLDTYVPLTIVAQRSDGAIDPDFEGHAWLWTDGPWIRPFHVRFSRADRGVIVMNTELNREVLQRIEAYEPGGGAHAWSNPAVPVAKNHRGRRLFFGGVGDCSAPGIDFCLAGRGARAANKSKPIVIESVQRTFRQETWLIAPSPALALAERDKIIAGIDAIKANSELLDYIKAHADSLLVVRGGGLEKVDLGGVPWVMAVDDAGKKGASGLDPRMFGQGGPVALVGQGDGLAAIWSEGDGAASIWIALRRGAAYGSWGSRIMIDLSAESGGFKGMLAGEGPRETVTLYSLGKKELSPLRSWATDDFHLELSWSGGMEQGRGALLAAAEPGSLLSGRALALLGPALLGR